MKPKQFIKHPVGLMRQLATKRVIKQWAQKFDFVYFGFVDQKADDHEFVGGITFSAQHKDHHYTVGSFRNHDFVLVERQNTLKFPGKTPQSYRWLLMQIDLKRAYLPHLFIDANHHEEVFYANLFVAFSQFDNVSRLFMHRDHLFAKHFKVFTLPDAVSEVDELLSTEITAMLAHHFRQFDYEIFEDRLVIYASNSVITSHLLQEMMRVGMWLADQINSQEK